MRPRRTFLTPRLRGLSGPFFHPWAPSGPLVKGVGNYIGTVGGNGLKVYPLSFLVYIDEGSVTPVERVVSIEATDADGDQVAWTLTEAYSWVSLSSVGDTGATDVTITIDPTDVGFPAEGGTISILAESAGVASGSPQTITLEVVVVPAPESVLILTEGGSFLLTEGSDQVSQE